MGHSGLPISNKYTGLLQMTRKSLINNTGQSYLHIPADGLLKQHYFIHLLTFNFDQLVKQKEGCWHNFLSETRSAETANKRKREQEN